MITFFLKFKKFLNLVQKFDFNMVNKYKSFLNLYFWCLPIEQLNFCLIGFKKQLYFFHVFSIFSRRLYSRVSSNSFLTVFDFIYHYTTDLEVRLHIKLFRKRFKIEYQYLNLLRFDYFKYRNLNGHWRFKFMTYKFFKTYKKFIKSLKQRYSNGLLYWKKKLQSVLPFILRKPDHLSFYTDKTNSSLLPLTKSGYVFNWKNIRLAVDKMNFNERLTRQSLIFKKQPRKKGLREYKQLINNKLYNLTFHSLEKPKRDPKSYSPEQKQSWRRYKRFKARTTISCSYGDWYKLFSNTILEKLCRTDTWLSSYWKVKPKLLLSYFMLNPSAYSIIKKIHLKNIKRGYFMKSYI